MHDVQMRLGPFFTRHGTNLDTDMMQLQHPSYSVHMACKQLFGCHTYRWHETDSSRFPFGLAQLWQCGPEVPYCTVHVALSHCATLSIELLVPLSSYTT